MKLNCKIGDIIHSVDVRNANLQCDNLLGLSMTKEFRPSTSNIVGTDLSKYKIVGFNHFAVDFMSAIRVHKMPIALNQTGKNIIVSPAYGVFAVNDENVVLPEFLMLWFRRPDFDRYADFKSDSAIRGGYDWNELCETDIDLPPISEQRKIVHDYQVITDRIGLLRKMNENLEEQGIITYKHYFLDYAPYSKCLVEKKEGSVPANWSVMTLGDICEKVTDGSHYSPVETENSMYPMLSVKDMGHYGFDYSSCKYMDKADFEKMLSGDCVPQIDDILIAKDGSYLKEVFIINSYKEQGILSSIAIFRANRKLIYPEMLLYLLKSPQVLREVKENYVTGSAITRIVLKNFKKLKVVVPPLSEQEKIVPLLRAIRYQIDENNKEMLLLNDWSNYYLSLLSLEGA